MALLNAWRPARASFSGSLACIYGFATSVLPLAHADRETANFPEGPAFGLVCLNFAAWNLPLRFFPNPKHRLDEKRKALAGRRFSLGVQSLEGCAFEGIEAIPYSTVKPGVTKLAKTTSSVANEQRNWPRQVSEIALENDSGKKSNVIEVASQVLAAPHNRTHFGPSNAQGANV